jgi:hypothetical protein
VAQAEALVFEALYYSDIYALSVVNFGNTPFYRKVAQKIDVQLPLGVALAHRGGH